MSAVGGDDDRCGKRDLAAADRDGDAGHVPKAARVASERTPHHCALLESAAGADRVLQQNPVEIAPEHRAAADAVRVAALDRDAALARQHHPVDAQAARLDLVGDAERAQPRERARVHRVAAEFVARKGGAVEDADAGAGAREDEAGTCARRPPADDDDVRPGQ